MLSFLKTFNKPKQGIIQQNKNEPTIKAPIWEKDSLNILLVADTHNCLTKEKASEIEKYKYDICISLGDVSFNDLKLLKEYVPKDKLYGVMGNHDGRDLLKISEINNIHCKVIHAGTIRIAGMEGSIRYKSGDWVMHTDVESEDYAAALKESDIFISHDSPKYLFTKNDLAHTGLTGVSHYINKYNVKLHICGHHHIDKISILDNGTVSLCVYGCKILKLEKGVPIVLENVIGSD